MYEIKKVRPMTEAEVASYTALLFRNNKPCCDKAVVCRELFCVCNYVSECPDHGRRCNGSHD